MIICRNKEGTISRVMACPSLYMHPFGASYLAMFIRQIAYYKIPRYVKFVDEYPMTASGKVSEMKVISLKMDC